MTSTNKAQLHELVPGDVLFVTFETGKALPGLAADPIGYAQQHRAETLDNLEAVGLFGEKLTGKAGGNVADIGGNPGTRWLVSYGIRIVEKLETPDAEALQAGFPIVGVLWGAAAAGLSAAAVIAAYNLTKPNSGGLNVLSNAAAALKAAGEGARELGEGLKFALPLAAVGGIVWIWKR